MSRLFKVAETDLSLFTGENTWVVLTAKESEHGYDYNVSCYSDNADLINVVEEHHMFYDQTTADKAVSFMAAKIKEILS